MLHTNYFTNNNMNSNYSSGKTQPRFILCRWSPSVYNIYGDADIDMTSDGRPDRQGYFNQHYRSGGMNSDGIVESRLYCLLDTVKLCVVGYFGISCSDMHLPKVGFSRITGGLVKLLYGREAMEDYIRGRKAFGAISIDYFAICSNYRGKTMIRNSHNGDEFKFSEYLMSKCIETCRRVADSLGVGVVMLHSTNEGMSTYYKFGFEFLYENDYNMFISSYPKYRAWDRQCVDTAFTYITSRSSCEDACVPMVLRI